MSSNQQLQQAVRDELHFDPSLAGAAITVEAKEGAVSLSGSVPSYAEKRFALKAAQRLRGVRQVIDRIQVSLPATAKVGDAELTTRVNQSLAWNASIPSGVTAKIQDGAVTLVGEVPFRYQMIAAERTVGALHGVRSIVNHIALKPSSPPTQATADNISKALKRLAVDGEGIRVSADQGKIYLTGTVENAYQRELAEHVAWSEPGVTQVSGDFSIN